MNHVASIPLVNLYVIFLRENLRRVIGESGLPLWPNGKRCAIALSHDVDAPVKYPLFQNFRFPRNPRSLFDKRFLLGVVRDLRGYCHDDNPDDYWLFEQIVEEESRYGFKSTFFFASESVLDQIGTPEDVSYDISRPRFRDLFDQLEAADFEIGLHASYAASEDVSHFVRQKRKLERQCKSKVTGLRHHYWHLGGDLNRCLRMHEDAGFSYDSSISFNSEIGFRRNVALPFFPYDGDTNSPTKCLELPPFCMDGALFYNSHGVGEAVEKLMSQVKILGKCEGFGAIDWHARTSFPGNREYRDWGETYIRVLRALSKDEGIWVAPMRDICSWMNQRRNTLSKITV
jgi:hypothetical protein